MICWCFSQRNCLKRNFVLFFFFRRHSGIKSIRTTSKEGRRRRTPNTSSTSSFQPFTRSAISSRRARTSCRGSTSARSPHTSKSVKNYCVLCCLCWFSLFVLIYFRRTVCWRLPERFCLSWEIAITRLTRNSGSVTPSFKLSALWCNLLNWLKYRNYLLKCLCSKRLRFHIKISVKILLLITLNGILIVKLVVNMFT